METASMLILTKVRKNFPRITATQKIKQAASWVDKIIITSFT